jgi:S1-C subfamily serine protease
LPRTLEGSQARFNVLKGEEIGAAMSLKSARAAVVQVGGGRGFVVAAGEDRYVVTAAHCVPREQRPTPHLANTSKLTCRDIIGTRGKKPTIWGDLCVYILTNDVAVFTAPDAQDLSDRHDRYVSFTERRSMVIGRELVAIEPYLRTPANGAPAFVLSLAGEWHPCTVHYDGRLLTISGALIEGGMSGSPIINADGAAIGLISTSDADGMNIHPSLMGCLPPWLLAKLDNLNQQGD